MVEINNPHCVVIRCDGKDIRYVREQILPSYERIGMENIMEEYIKSHINKDDNGNSVLVPASYKITLISTNKNV